jgi:putative inorganic carbon (HCO3(-)) transporter
VSRAAAWFATLATSGGIVVVFLLYLPPLQAPFLVPKFAVLEIAASIGLVAFAMRRATSGRPRWRWPLAVAAWLVLATTVLSWIGASRGSLGAPYAVDAIARWAALFGMACAASVVDDDGARWRVLEAVTVAGAAVAGIGLLQHTEVLQLSIPVISTPGSTFGNRNQAAEAIAMALPFGVRAAASTPKRGSQLLLGAAVVLELLFLGATRARGAWIGAACALAALAFLARARLSRTSIAVGIVAIAAAGAAASIPGHFNPRDAGDAKRYAGVVEILEEGLDTRGTAVRTRLGIWRRTVEMIREHPVLGVGPGNWPVAFPLHAEPDALQDGVLTATRAPRQAHDDLLERTAETGGLGLLALGALVAATTVAARRRLVTVDDDAHSASAAAVASLIALAAISVGSFPLEMPATIALAGIALGFLAGNGQDTAAARGAAHRESPSASRGALVVRFAVVAGALLVVSCTVARARRNLKASRWLGVAESAMHRDRGTRGAAEALPALEHALDATPASYRAELRVSQMLLREGRANEAASAARRALAIEPYAPEAWTALAAADLGAGDAGAGRRDASEALRLFADDPFALHLRAQAATKENDLAGANADQTHLRALADHSSDPDTGRAARALVNGE